MFTQQAKCFKALFKVTSGMMCLACNANYATEGLVKSGETWTLTLNNGVCDRINKFCFDYIDQMA